MDSAEESNTLMNKYKVGKKIGSGSFGYIYKCIFDFIQVRTFRTNHNMP